MKKVVTHVLERVSVDDINSSDPRFQGLLRRMNFAEPEPPCLLGGEIASHDLPREQMLRSNPFYVQADSI